MGMDLKPIEPNASAPRMSSGAVQWGRYNISGWAWLVRHLRAWDVNTSEFSNCNDGAVISGETCRLVADAIERHLPELHATDRYWLQPTVVLWRTCGGYEQW